MAAAESLKMFLDAGMSEDSMLEIARVLGEGTARLSSTITGAFVDTYLEPGDTERDVALRFAAMAKQLLPLMAPVLNAALAAHLREAARRGIISRAERESGQLARTEEVVVCFADIVGFTSLGGEVAVEELGTVAREFADLSAEVSSETVRLVKTIGDAAMFVSDDAKATVGRGAEAGRGRQRGRSAAAAGRHRLRPGADACGGLVRPVGQPREPGHRRRAPGQRALHRRGSRRRPRGVLVVLRGPLQVEGAAEPGSALSRPHSG